jgi:thioredoxin reductase (NADPH)
VITPDLLKDVPLFAEVPAAELSTIAARAADIQLRAGEWLIHEGEAPAFFIVLSRVRAHSLLNRRRGNA